MTLPTRRQRLEEWDICAPTGSVTPVLRTGCQFVTKVSYSRKGNSSYSVFGAWSEHRGLGFSVVGARRVGRPETSWGERKMKHAAAVIITTMIVVVAGGAAAQTTHGDIQGTVSDAWDRPCPVHRLTLLPALPGTHSTISAATVCASCWSCRRGPTPPPSDCPTTDPATGQDQGRYHTTVVSMSI